MILSFIYVALGRPDRARDAPARQGPARPRARAPSPRSGAPTSPTRWPRARRRGTSSDERRRPRYVLGISCFYHDSAAALLKDGDVVAAGQEERFTRKRHDSGLPRAGDQVRAARGRASRPSSSTTSASTTSRCSSSSACSRTYVATFPRSFRSFRKAMPLWLQEKLWVPSIIRKELKPYKGPILFAEHHMSHAASCFLASPFEEAAILTVDGVGEWATASLRRRPRQRHQALQGDPLPALAGPALQRLHLLPRLQGEQRRVQGDGARALRQADALRADHEGHGPPERRRLVQAEHEVLRVRLRPAHDQRGLRRASSAARRASPRAG